jgi:hypothetical protein
MPGCLRLLGVAPLASILSATLGKNSRSEFLARYRVGSRGLRPPTRAVTGFSWTSPVTSKRGMRPRQPLVVV